MIPIILPLVKIGVGLVGTKVAEEVTLVLLEKLSKCTKSTIDDKIYEVAKNAIKGRKKS